MSMVNIQFDTSNGDISLSLDGQKVDAKDFHVSKYIFESCTTQKKEESRNFSYTTQDENGISTTRSFYYCDGNLEVTESKSYKLMKDIAKAIANHRAVQALEKLLNTKK